MESAHPVSALMFGTIGIVLVLLLGAYFFFIRKRSNREAGDRMPERGEPGAPNVPRGTPIDPGYRAKDRV